MSFWNGKELRRVEYHAHARRILFGHVVNTNSKLNLEMAAFVRDGREQLVLGTTSAAPLLNDGEWIGSVARSSVRQRLHILGELIKGRQATCEQLLAQRTGRANGEVQWALHAVTLGGDAATGRLRQTAKRLAQTQPLLVAVVWLRDLQASLDSSFQPAP